MSKLTLTVEGDTHVIAKRHFRGSPEQVFRAHTDPEIVQKWMLGPPGWSMPVCKCDAKANGTFRYEWTNDSGEGAFHQTGEFLVVEPFTRLVHVERMFLPDPTPDSRVETTFVAENGGTLMTLRMTLPDAASRKMMLDTGMEHGMEASYARLEEVSGWAANA